MKIGITGGKGGTGKSTVAVALAVELGKKYNVLLVDMDADCPNDHLLLDVKRKLMHNVEQRIPMWDMDKCIKCGACGPVCKTNAIVSIKKSNPIFVDSQCNGCGACVIKCPVKAIGWDKKDIGYIYSGNNYGIDLLSGELKINEPLSEVVINSMKKIVEGKNEDYDFIIYDTAAGTHCDVISALEDCDLAFAVTEPTPLGAHDLGLILQLLKILNKESSIVLNMADIGDKRLVEDIAKDYQVEIVARIPYSKEIIEDYSRGVPIREKNISYLADMVSKKSDVTEHKPLQNKK